MIYLSIFALFIACASALFGIWTAKELVLWKARIATGFTVVSLTVGVILLISQQQSATRSREDLMGRLQVLQAATPMTSLDVSWTLPGDQPRLASALPLDEAIEYGESRTDDEFGRMPRDRIQSVLADWHLENAVVPVLAALADENSDVKNAYSGDVDKALAIFSADGAPDMDEDEAWLDVRYDGPSDPLFILPLNLTLSGALALGRRSDVAMPVEPDPEGDNYDALNTMVANARAYGFSAQAEKTEKGLVLSFHYDADQLNRAAQLAEGHVRSIMWPDEFNFVLVREGFPADLSYLEAFGRVFSAPAKGAGETSELTITANGLPWMQTRYRVQRAGSADYTIDNGGYEAMERPFSYTLFHAVKIDR